MTDLSQDKKFLLERVDELYALEKKAEERAERLTVVAKDCQVATEAKMEQFIEKLDKMNQTVVKANEICDKVEGHIALHAKRADKALWFFVGSLTLSVIMVSAASLWSRHLYNDLKETQLELGQANLKLNHKPIFLSEGDGLFDKGGDYVRVVPNTETKMTHTNGKDYPGVYAEIWHKEGR